jgi:hypothetical protein
MPSVKINVILLAVGSFLLGAVCGVLVYDSTWGFEDTLIRLSDSFDAQSYAPIYGIIGAIGALLVIIGVLNLFWKKPWKNWVYGKKHS